MRGDERQRAASASSTRVAADGDRLAASFENQRARCSKRGGSIKRVESAAKHSLSDMAIS